MKYAKGCESEIREAVCRSLEASGDAELFEIVDVIVEARSVVMRCKQHGLFTKSWRAVAEKGKRCGACEVESSEASSKWMIEKAKLNEEARMKGLRPVVDDMGAYIDQREEIGWICTAPDHHRLVGGARDLLKTGCKVCLEDRMGRCKYVYEGLAGIEVDAAARG